MGAKEECKIHGIGWKIMSMSKFHGGLGFKSLSMFNMTLLAKQGWRIVNNENSLLHRVFKAKYFPNYSLFEANLGSNHSFTWLGIWEARCWLEKECLWRIENEKNVRVW